MIKDNEELVTDLFKVFAKLRKVKVHPHVHDEYGITHTEMMVLFCIREALENQENKDKGIKISQISKIMKVASPTVTQQITNLEKNGFVERKMDTNDRRVVRIEFTEKGEAVMKKAKDNVYNFLKGLVDYLGEDKSVELTELLMKVADYINKENN